MKSKKTHERYIAELAETNPTIECLEEYRGATDKVKHRCLVCGHEWLVRPTTLISAKPKGCPHCAAVKAGKARASYTTKTYQDKLLLVHRDIELAEEYKGSHQNTEFHCKRCGYRWSAMPYSVLQGHGCPRCAKSGTSFMEQVFLHAIILRLKGDEVLSRTKNAIGEELDIFIPSMRIAIEPGSWDLHKSRLWKDREKKTLSETVGIRLIFVYDKFPTDQEPPFKEDCLIYPGDFNKDDHNNLWNTVDDLFALMNLTGHFTGEEKAAIENDAYKASKSLTHEIFVERMGEIHPNIEVCSKYFNANKRIKCKCRECGWTWDAVPASLLSGDGCWDCARKSIGEKERMSVEDFVSKLKEVNPDISIARDTFRGTHAPVKATCEKCGKSWEPTARTLIRANPCGCSACRAKERKTARAAKYLKILSETKPYISCLEEYENKETKLLHRCNVCGHEWRTTPATILKSVYGCPKWKQHRLIKSDN